MSISVFKGSSGPPFRTLEDITVFKCSCGPPCKKIEKTLVFSKVPVGPRAKHELERISVFKFRVSVGPPSQPWKNISVFNGSSGALFKKLKHSSKFSRTSTRPSWNIATKSSPPPHAYLLVGRAAPCIPCVWPDGLIHPICIHKHIALM